MGATGPGCATCVPVSDTGRLPPVRGQRHCSRPEHPSICGPIAPSRIRKKGEHPVPARAGPPFPEEAAEESAKPCPPGERLRERPEGLKRADLHLLRQRRGTGCDGALLPGPRNAAPGSSRPSQGQAGDPASAVGGSSPDGATRSSMIFLISVPSTTSFSRSVFATLCRTWMFVLSSFFARS